MSFLFFIIGMILGSYLFGWLRVLFLYLIFHAKGYTCLRVAGLFIRWDKDYYDPVRPGKMKFTFSSRLNQLHPTIMMYKRPEKGEQRKNMVLLGIDISLTALFMVLLLSFEFVPFDGLSRNVANLLGGLCAGGFTLFFTISNLNYKASETPTGLRARTKELMESLLFAEKVEDIAIQPFDQVSYVNANLNDKLSYLVIFYRVSEIRNDLSAMAECVKVMTELKTLSLTDSGHFYLDAALFSHYSFRQKDPALASQYFSHSRKNIEADKDANGRRRLAYYCFYILGDREAARRYAVEGLNTLSVDDPRVYKMMRVFEEQMLRYLLSQLDA